MNLIQCFQTHSNWYKNAVKNGTPIGVLWHDTGAGNPNLKRYVQPYDGDPDYENMIAIIGKNQYNNDWNHSNVQSGVNAWIGKLADGSIATIQAGEWDMHPWGCGNGAKGSCNGYEIKNGVKNWVKPLWIQFEICDDGYKDKNYFLSVYKEACELTAYLCMMYDVDPYGTYEFNGVSVPTILCHADAHKLELGSNHGDVLTWFKKFGFSMEDVRNDVSRLIKETNNSGADRVEYLKTNDEAKDFLNDLINHINDYFKK